MRNATPSWLTAVVVLMTVFIFTNSSGAKALYQTKEGNYSLWDENFHFSPRLQLGYATGKANEILYADSYTVEVWNNHEWEIDELFLVGLGGTLQKKWVCLHGDLWIKATDGDGNMENYEYNFGTGWSDWSGHDDTKVTEAYMIDVNFEFMIPPISFDRFVTSAFLGYKHEQYEWEASGGTFIGSSNPGWHDLTGTFPAGQTVYKYNQAWDLPYIGIGVKGSVGNFEWSCRLIGSLYATLNAKTHNHVNGLRTDAKMKKGEVISIDLTGGYHITDNLLFEISYCYTKYDKVRGDSIFRYPDGTGDHFVDPEGGDLETSLFSLVLSYSF